jgi:hypothetical protein
VTEIEAAHLNNLEAKVGVDGSAVVTSLDYLLKNPASLDPGHKHSGLWASDGDPQAVRVAADGNVGIGTANPGAKLEVNGQIYVQRQAYPTPSLAFSDDPDTGFGSVFPNQLTFYAGGTYCFNATVGGNLQFKDWRVMNTGEFPRIAGALINNASAIALKIGNENALTTAGAKIVSFYNDMWTTEKAYIDVSGGAYFAGNVGIGITPNAAALLHLVSTTKGFLPPVMTTAQKNAISTPPAGLMVYDSDLNKLCVYTGGAWQTVTST